jgi:hypothetical protein
MPPHPTHTIDPQEETRQLDVRMGVAQHLLLFDWRLQAAREKEGEEGGANNDSLLFRAAEGAAGGFEELEEEDEEEEGEEGGAER